MKPTAENRKLTYQKLCQVCQMLHQPYMPYLTLWDEISQNLAHLEANSHKNFQICTEFSDHLTTHLMKKINLHHTLLFSSQASYIWQFWGSFKVIFVKISQNFIKSSLRICLTSQISIHSLWHVWSAKSILTLRVHLQCYYLWLTFFFYMYRLLKSWCYATHFNNTRNLLMSWSMFKKCLCV